MDKLRQEVWRANLSLRQNNLVYGTQGNVSGILRREETIYIKPSGVAYEELGAEMITRTGLDGTVLEGERFRPSVDTVHHAFLYRKMKDIGGVCHTHSKFVTVFSILGIGVPVLTTAQADVFGQEIPVTGYVGNKGENIGRALLDAFEKTGCRAVILGRHGLFSVGENPLESAYYALMAEYCAETAYLALAAGGKIGPGGISPLEESEIADWYRRFHSSGYGQAK